MKKKVSLILIICLICLCFTGCKNKTDSVTIYNKCSDIFDDINIDIKAGYFYDRHEKFTVDENTIGVTIYFSNNGGTWD